MRTRLTTPIFTLATLLLIGSYIAWTLRDESLYLKNNPTHTYNVMLRNKLDQGYIWIDDNVRILIWEEGADASKDPVHIITNGKVVFDSIRTGSGYLLPAGGEISGILTLLEDFQLNRYIRNHNELVFSVYVLENGIYSGKEQFVPDPKYKFGAAFATVELRKSPNFKSLFFEYPYTRQRD